MEIIQKDDSIEEKIRKIIKAIDELQIRVIKIEHIIEDIPTIETILIDNQEKLKGDK